MNPFIQYVITLLIIFLIVTLLIKILVIPVFNFYENVNVAIWLSLIIIAGIFFYPKTIFTGYGIPDQSCTCLGIRTSTEETYLKRIVCSGLAYSCYDYSTFKSKAAQSPKLCSNKNDFFSDADTCYKTAAQEFIQKSPSNFDHALSICKRIQNPNIQKNCIDLLDRIKSGQPIF